MFFKFALEVFGCFTNESFWHNIVCYVIRAGMS